MALKYLYSGATGTADGTSWTNAYTAFTTAYAACAAGDTLYVANDHNETVLTAITATTANGTDTAPINVICVNRLGTVPPVAADITTGAVIQSQANVSLSATSGGFVYFNGVSLFAGQSNTTTVIYNMGPAAGGGFFIFENCTIGIKSTGPSSRITLPGSRCELINTTINFASTGQAFNTQLGELLWRNTPGTAALSGTTPTTLFKAQAGLGYNTTTLQGLDLSALTTVIGAGGMNYGTYRFINCKMPTFAYSVPTEPYFLGYELIGCNASTNVERNERYTFSGTLTTEPTIIKSSGATDGTTAYSWKVVTTGNATYRYPFRTFEGVIWNTSTGVSKTLTVHAVTDNVPLTNADLWLEVDYLSSSTASVSNTASSGLATVLTANSALTSDSATTWTTTGLTTPNKQKASVTFTPQMVGPVRWRVRVAKPSTTTYIDPNPDLV